MKVRLLNNFDEPAGRRALGLEAAMKSATRLGQLLAGPEI
jgi:hypothetical protein